MIKIVCYIIAVFLLTGSIMANDYIDAVDKGNDAFKAGQFKEALEQYYVAESQIPATPELDYNIAGALYEHGKYEEAVDRYQKALNTTDINLEAAAHYNLGNTYYRMGDYAKAIEGYQNSLEINPDDMNAKLNLELARKMLKENTQAQNPQNNQQQQQQKQQEKQEEQDQQKQEQNQQDQQQNQQQQQDQQQQQQQQDQKMSREDAERILNALRDDEKETQKKARKVRASGDYLGKDW